jgi:hypothetical protein
MHARTHGRMHGRTDRWTENIYSIFRDKLLLLGEHVHGTYKTQDMEKNEKNTYT